MTPIGEPGHSPAAPALSREPLPPRKKPSIFVRILLFGFACAFGLFLGAIYVVARAPITGRIFSLMGEQRRMMQAETTAPGASELRKSGPCQQVIIVGPANRTRTRELAGGRRRRGHHEPPANETLVTCMPFMFRNPPACDDLASAYVSAAHPSGPFHVTVPKGFSAKLGCSSDYDSTGSPLSLDGGI
jgi:hypothetical protein